MQLAPFQMLAPVVAIGASSWCVGRAMPGGHGWPRAVGTALVVTSVLVAGLYGLFLAIGSAMERDPGLAAFASIAALSGIGLLALLFSARRGAAPEPGDRSREDDGGGGGGQRRPDPDPPAPVPGGGPAVRWDEFDDARAGWEQVPAGTR